MQSVQLDRASPTLSYLPRKLLGNTTPNPQEVSGGKKLTRNPLEFPETHPLSSSSGHRRWLTLGSASRSFLLHLSSHSWGRAGQARADLL